jgi:hypothetical protein
MLSQEMELRVEFALNCIGRIQDRFDEVEDHLSLLEYAISLVSKRIDEIEKRSP